VGEGDVGIPIRQTMAMFLLTIKKRKGRSFTPGYSLIGRAYW